MEGEGMKTCLLNRERKGEERKTIFLPNLFAFREVWSSTKLRDLSPSKFFVPNPSPPNLLSKQRKLHLSKFLPFHSFQFLQSKRSVCDLMHLEPTDLIIPHWKYFCPTTLKFEIICSHNDCKSFVCTFSHITLSSNFRFGIYTQKS